MMLGAARNRCNHDEAGFGGLRSEWLRTLPDRLKPDVLVERRNVYSRPKADTRRIANRRLNSRGLTSANLSASSNAGT